MKKKVVSLVAILALVGTSSVFASEIKHYVLTEFTSPIVINNQKYSNEALPILSYQDNTYVPLKAVGKLLGKNVNWNTSKKQIEIQNDTFYLDESEYGKPKSDFVKLINQTVKAINVQDNFMFFSLMTPEGQTNFPEMPKHQILIVNHYDFINITTDKADVKVDLYFKESATGSLKFSNSEITFVKKDDYWKITGYSFL